MNASKTNLILSAPKPPHIHSVGTDFDTKCLTILGHYVNVETNWSEHKNNVIKKCKLSMFALSRTKNILLPSARRNMYNSLFKSSISYSKTNFYKEILYYTEESHMACFPIKVL